MSNKISYKLLFIQLISLGLSTAVLAQETPKPVVTIVRPATAPGLGFPLDCAYGTDCWTMNYTDLSPENDAKSIDNACLARTYDGHTGTDFAVRDIAMMTSGVDVLAVASGTIVRIRNGEEDHLATPKEQDGIKAAKKECGNGILLKLSHSDAKPWYALYCHLKKDSITVKPGDRIEQGQKLARVGLSGLTDYPHLHIGLTHGDDPIDPFTGRALSGGCTGFTPTPLWSEKSGLVYEPLFIGPSGFSEDVPTLGALRQKNAPAHTLDHRGAGIVFYTTLWGIRAGDVVDVEVRDPHDKIFAKDHIQQGTHRARQLYYIGRKQAQGAPFEKGNYTASLSIKRMADDNQKDLVIKKKFVVTVQ